MADDNVKKVACFVSVIGPVTYGILRNLVAPAKPKDKSLDSLYEALAGHYTEKRLVIAERFRFYSANQKEGESVLEFIARLKKLARFCDFGDTLNDMLRDKLVCGLKATSIQQKLLASDNLTLVLAQRMAVGDEAARKDVALLNKARQTDSVNALKATKSTTPQAQPKKFNNGAKKSADKSDNQSNRCKHCGRKNHESEDCKFKNATCYKCNVQGHIATVCRTKKSGVNTVSEVTGDYDSDDNVQSLYTLREGRSLEGPILCQVTVGDKQLEMELDTGSGKTLISSVLYHRDFGNYELMKSDVKLETYTKELVHPVGYFMANVTFKNQTKYLAIYVIDREDAAPLFGRSWYHSFGMGKSPSSGLNQMSSQSELSALLEKHSELFGSDLGKVKGVTARLKVKPEAKPAFWKARPVSYARKTAVGIALNDLEAQGIIESIEFSEWAAPIVTPTKRNGDIRICGDFKVTVNPVLDVDIYPLPRIEEIFANLSGGKTFSTLDLKNAYLQLEVHPDDRKYLTVNTHQGLYRYKRMVFGIASAPAIWQQTLDQILKGIPGTPCYLDDIIITGTDTADHMRNLKAVFNRLQSYGLRLNRNKCEFLKAEVFKSTVAILLMQLACACLQRKLPQW